jgi:hypothetical protein
VNGPLAVVAKETGVGSGAPLTVEVRIPR